MKRSRFRYKSTICFFVLLCFFIPSVDRCEKGVFWQDSVQWQGYRVSICGDVFAASLKKAPAIKGNVWFNTAGRRVLDMDQLMGKVVLVFFWSANDYNCQEVVPFLNDLYKKYKDKGLEIIGVHSFEWGFDASNAVLYDKIQSFHIEFPVVNDDTLETKKAYEQLLLPSYCLVDKNGYIRACYKSGSGLETLIESLLEQGRSRMFDEEV